MHAYLKAQGISLSASTVVDNGPIDAAIDRYRHYLVHERGLGQLTVRHYSNAVRPFLLNELSSDGTRMNWESVDAARVTAFVVARTPSQSRSVASTTVTALRSFLGYLYVNGLIKQQLTAAVPAVAGWRLAALPKTLQPREVQALLAACDRRTRMGRRDFAVLTILVRLGLRASELAGLRLDDIDWRKDVLHVRHSKTGAHSILPLLPQPGEALLAYLRDARPQTALREVFLCLKAPLRPFRDGSALYSTIRDRLTRAGVSRAGKKGPHAFRHARAVSLLRAAVPLKAIGDILGHRSALSTGAYLKLATEDLRAVALDIPTAVSP